MQSDTDIATSLTKLASDYGPFLFAILFTLIVPVRAYQNFRDCTTKFSQPSELERELIRESETYFRSTWVAGFVLIAFSVGWWLYLNYDVRRNVDRNYWISYEGNIGNVSADDVLDSPPDAHVYVWAVDQPYRHYQYVVLSHQPVLTAQPIPLYWLSARLAGNQVSGYNVLPVSFLLDPKRNIYTLRHDGAHVSIVPN